jgi:hypothetical protein
MSPCHVTVDFVYLAFESSPNFCYSPRGKPQRRSVVEAINQFKWAATPMPNTYGVFQLSYAVDVHVYESLVLSLLSSA